MVTKCTAEIEHRALGVQVCLAPCQLTIPTSDLALSMARLQARCPFPAPALQGIYRVSGSRVRVERLCQAFENGRALVDLSGNSPHDISSVLKRFLQEVGAQGAGPGGLRLRTLCSSPTPVSPSPFHPQLTDPVVPFHLYDGFISLAKALHADPGHNPGTPSPSPEVIRLLKNLLVHLPDSNYNTLRHLVAHLFRCALSLMLKCDPRNRSVTLFPGPGTTDL